MASAYRNSEFRNTERSAGDYGVPPEDSTRTILINSQVDPLLRSTKKKVHIGVHYGGDPTFETPGPASGAWRKLLQCTGWCSTYPRACPWPLCSPSRSPAHLASTISACTLHITNIPIHVSTMRSPPQPSQPYMSPLPRCRTGLRPALGSWHPGLRLPTCLEKSRFVCITKVLHGSWVVRGSQCPIQVESGGLKNPSIQP